MLHKGGRALAVPDQLRFTSDWVSYLSAQPLGLRDPLQAGGPLRAWDILERGGPQAGQPGFQGLVCRLAPEVEAGWLELAGPQRWNWLAPSPACWGGRLIPWQG